mmetsp:Transcript_9637/g.29024  ORF Transcript_9637/g.29024 Transcript_9637/m.29024 type:complete len:230 (+) Transcript_9637:692-1381(+)
MDPWPCHRRPRQGTGNAGHVGLHVWFVALLKVSRFLSTTTNHVPEQRLVEAPLCAGLALGVLLEPPGVMAGKRLSHVPGRFHENGLEGMWRDPIIGPCTACVHHIITVPVALISPVNTIGIARHEGRHIVARSQHCFADPILAHHNDSIKAIFALTYPERTRFSQDFQTLIVDSICPGLHPGPPSAGFRFRQARQRCCHHLDGVGKPPCECLCPLKARGKVGGQEGPAC